MKNRFLVAIQTLDDPHCYKHDTYTAKLEEAKTIAVEIGKELTKQEVVIYDLKGPFMEVVFRMKPE